MTWHVFISTPPAGFAGAFTPYSVECKEVWGTREEAQAFADAKTMSAGVKAMLDAMPSAFPAWSAGVFGNSPTYVLGSYIGHSGKTWRCTNTNTPHGNEQWAPGVAPSLWLKVQPPGYTAWEQPTWYALPSQATHGGRLYQLVQAHDSQIGREPNVYTAGWTDIGSASLVLPYTRARWDVVSSTDPDYTERNRAQEPA